MLDKICNTIDSVNTFFGSLAGWLATLLVLVVAVDVTMRYLFNTGYVAIQELEWHLFSYIFLLGAAKTFLVDGHVRVDIFYQNLSEKGRAWINTIGFFVFLTPACYLIIFTSIPYAYTSFKIGEGSPDPGGIPYVFILKFAVTLGFVLVYLQGISSLIRNVKLLMGENK